MSTISCDMVSENRNEALRSNVSITWNGDWESYKRGMEATGILNGLEEALVRGEELARGEAKTEPTAEADGEAKPVELTITSKKLAAILLLSLESTKGPQQSIAVNRRWGEEYDGIRMWADLIRHFERGSTELRKLDLRREWENSTTWSRRTGRKKRE